MKKYKVILLLVNLLLVLAFFHYSVYEKEGIVDKGRLILLRLAPVDPRSLMQGDYMALRYAITDDLDNDNIAPKGYCVVALDSGKIARLVRVQPAHTPLAPGEYLIRYNARDRSRMRIGAESYFFEEGQADKYDSARFGGLRVDYKGNSVLVGLYDEQKRLIQ